MSARVSRVVVIAALAALSPAESTWAQATAGLVAVTVKDPALGDTHSEMIRVTVADELSRLGVVYVPPEALGNFDESDYVLELEVEIDIYSHATRIEYHLLRVPTRTDLFSHATWLPGNNSAQRVLDDIARVSAEFREKIGPLYEIHKSQDRRPLLFADCIFPPKSPNDGDWDLAQYVTMSYAEVLRTNDSAARLRVFGIDRSRFEDWCRSADANRPFSPDTFQFTISGQIFRFTTGLRLLIFFSPADEQPKTTEVKFPVEPENAPQTILNAVKGFIAEN
jgi:hypothetical protein